LDSDYTLRGLAATSRNNNYLHVGWFGVLEDGTRFEVNDFLCIVAHIGDNDTVLVQPIWRTIINYQVVFMLNDGTGAHRTGTWQANSVTGANAALVIPTQEQLFLLADGSPDPGGWWTHNGQSPANGSTPIWRIAGWTARPQQEPGEGDVTEHQLSHQLLNRTFQQIMDMRLDPNNQFRIRMFDDSHLPGYTWRIYVYAFWVEV